jgi:hypothetical protein
VRHPGRDDDHHAGPRHDPLPPHPEPHRPLDHLEALLLERMNVESAGDAAVRRELQVDRNEFPVGLGRCLPERDPLAACRVDQYLSDLGDLALLEFVDYESRLRV